MRTTWQTSIVVLAMLGIGWLLGTQTVTQGQPPVRLQRSIWAYHIEIASSIDEQRMKQLGDQGWELVTVFRQSDSEVRAYFKRSQ